MTAKVSDFGLALRAFPLSNGRGWGPVTVPPRGTPRYMAPELFQEVDEQGCVQVCGFACVACEGSPGWAHWAGEWA